MARSRNIKPGFFTNDDLCELEPLARLLFAGIWTIADRAGRLEDRPKKIKAEVLPYDNCDVESFLDQLACRGFILRYESSGKRFIQVLAWGKHQNPHCKESPSTIPAPDGYECQPDQKQQKHSASTVQAPCEAQPLPEQAGLIPDSLNLIPDSTTPNGVEAPQRVANKRGSRLPEDWFLPKPWGSGRLISSPHGLLKLSGLKPRSSAITGCPSRGRRHAKPIGSQPGASGAAAISRSVLTHPKPVHHRQKRHTPPT